MNAGDLISSSMRLIGALASGETMSSSEAADGLMVLNQMLDSWQAERLLAFTININEFPLVAGQQLYTMGPGGNFNVTRPAKIDRISIVSLQNPIQPLELPINYYSDWDWQNVPVKIIPSPLPQAVYDDGNYPLRNIQFWPIPSVICNTRIYSWALLNQFPDLITDLTFPPGYLEALRYNLAVRLIAEMPGEYAQITVSATQALAIESMARVRTANLTTIQAFCDNALLGQGGHYNYYSDTIVGGGNR